MIRYTTPTLQLIIEADLTGADVYATFRQACRELTKQNPTATVDEGVTTLSIPFTQEETADFADNLPVSVQVNWITPGGPRNATEIATFRTFANLLDEMIAYGN